MQGDFLILDFDLPNANSPVNLGISNDPRYLGMAVISLQLEADLH